MVCFVSFFFEHKCNFFYIDPGLSWPLYFAACCCGATVVAFLAWYAMENEVFRRKMRKFFLREDEAERSALTKITTNVLSTIVYVLNRIIKTTAHILVSPVSSFVVTWCVFSVFNFFFSF